MCGDAVSKRGNTGLGLTIDPDRERLVLDKPIHFLQPCLIYIEKHDSSQSPVRKVKRFMMKIMLTGMRNFGGQSCTLGVNHVLEVLRIICRHCDYFFVRITSILGHLRLCSNCGF